MPLSNGPLLKLLKSPLLNLSLKLLNLPSLKLLNLPSLKGPLLLKGPLSNQPLLSNRPLLLLLLLLKTEAPKLTESASPANVKGHGDLSAFLSFNAGSCLAYYVY